MIILSIGNCPLDPFLGSGKTRIEWSRGLRSLGHTVDTVDSMAFRRVTDILGPRLGLSLAGRLFAARTDFRRYDIVEFFGAEFWWATKALHAQARRPMIVAHTDGIELLAHDRQANAGLVSKGKMERWLPFFNYNEACKLAFTLSDRFVTGCRLDLEYVLDHGIYNGDHAVTVPLGIDPAYLGRPFIAERDNTVVYFGTWSERKGLPHITGVMSRFLANRPDWQFLVIGASDKSSAILESFEPGLRPRIEVAPKLPVEDVAQRLDRAKILFFPSEYEGFGLAIAEAMGCGCAAVVTPTGFGGDLIDAENALVCGFADQGAMLAALCRLADDEAFREKIARAGRHRVQALAWPSSVRLLEQTYLRWLEDWTRASSSISPSGQASQLAVES